MRFKKDSNLAQKFHNYLGNKDLNPVLFADKPMLLNGKLYYS